METVAIDNELVAIGGPTAITCDSGSSWLNAHKFRFYTFCSIIILDTVHVFSLTKRTNCFHQIFIKVFVHFNYRPVCNE